MFLTAISNLRDYDTSRTKRRVNASLCTNPVSDPPSKGVLCPWLRRVPAAYHQHLQTRLPLPLNKCIREFGCKGTEKMLYLFNNIEIFLFQGLKLWIFKRTAAPYSTLPHQVKEDAPQHILFVLSYVY